ncbi:MAG: GNAT family N-acetyltransferase [bacterium]
MAAVSPQMALTVSSVEDAQQIGALRQPWTDVLLTQAEPNVFLSWEWMTAWLQTRDGSGAPCVLLVRRPEDQAVVGLAPLYRPAGRPLGLRTLRFMGTGVGADHLGFLSRSGAEDGVHAALIGHLLADQTWDVLEFSRIQEALAARIVGALRAQDRYPHELTVADVCPFLPLPATWDDYLRIIGSNRRKQIARRWRRLRERGDVTIERVTNAAGLDTAWRTLLDLHRARRRALGRGSVFVTAEGVAFHARFARMALERGWLRLYLMRLGGRPVAAEYGLSVGGHVVSFQGGFDVRWARYGVGGLLVAHSVQEAIAAGAVEFDLLRGAEAYKHELGATERRTDMSLLVWRRHPRVELVVAARRWARGIRERLRLA